MKTIKKVNISTIFFDDVLPDFEEMQEAVLYISKDYKTGTHKCLCGCGNKVITPFNKTGWSYEMKDTRITIQPSIGNYNLPCQSHYIITKSVANFV